MRFVTIAVMLASACVLAVPAFAVDATDWGSGLYYIHHFEGTDLYRFDVTLTLKSLDFITNDSAYELADTSLEWKFTGMVWQPGTGDGPYFTTYQSASPKFPGSTPLPESDWVPGTLGTSTYGYAGYNGKAIVTVDEGAGGKYDIIADSQTEFGHGISLLATDDRDVSFQAIVRLPGDLTSQNMQMGWTGFRDGKKEKFVRGQNSIDMVMTPELPSGALLLLGMLPAGLAWLRRRKA